MQVPKKRVYANSNPNACFNILNAQFLQRMNFAITRFAAGQDGATQPPREQIALNSLQHIPSEYHSGYPSFSLNGFQRQFVDQLDTKESIVISAPTGAGKTYLQDVLYFRNLPNATLVVLPTKALLFERSQATRFAQFHLLHGDSAAHFGDLKYELVYATAEKAAELLTRRISSDFLKRLSLVVVDEAHFILTRQKAYATIFYAAAEHNLRICGFSAIFPAQVASRLGLRYLKHTGALTPAFEFEQIVDKNLMDLAKVH